MTDPKENNINITLNIRFYMNMDNTAGDVNLI